MALMLPSFQFPRILAIFYAEFHPIQGPTIVYDVPEGILQSAQVQNRLMDVEGVSDYVIPKAVAGNLVTTLVVGDYKLVGCPARVENARYARNAMLFNMVFVFARHADTRAYDPIVRKMADILRTLEVEGSYLHDTTKRPKIAMLMGQVYEDLNTMRECLIPIDDCHTVNLKLFPKLQEPPMVREHQVPVLLVPADKLKLTDWDITARKVVQHIDGMSHIYKIAERADVDVDKARKAVKHLVYYGVAVLVDIFQYANVYMTLDGAADLIDSPEFQQSCISFITRPGRTPLPFLRIFTLYCALQPGLTVRDWMESHPAEFASIDVRQVLDAIRLHNTMLIEHDPPFAAMASRMILFGVAHHILRRIHSCPFLPVERRRHVPAVLRCYLDGMHSYDQVCVALGYSPAELREILSKDPTFIEINR